LRNKKKYVIIYIEKKKNVKKVFCKKVLTGSMKCAIIKVQKEKGDKK